MADPDGGLWYRVAADAVLIAHACFVAFVVVGQVLVLAGLARRWRWVRGVWFRSLHLLAIAVVVLQSWVGAVCPLTSLESMLRRRAGGTGYADEGFIAHWLHRALFFDFAPWVFVAIYTAFGLLVLITWIVGPPRRATRG
ncbi:MAG: DUF2784 domain-containing protein [Planctomycetota bacterium]|jgi:hypothetical protein